MVDPADIFSAGIRLEPGMPGMVDTNYIRYWEVVEHWG